MDEQNKSDLQAIKQSIEGTSNQLDNQIIGENLRVQKIDQLGRSYATGKRKNAVARVWVKNGSGKIIVNGKSIDSYFARPVLRMIINQPFSITDRVDSFDVNCTVSGGGLSGQAGAVRHGISKALTLFDPSLRYCTLVTKIAVLPTIARPGSKIILQLYFFLNFSTEFE